MLPIPLLSIVVTLVIVGVLLWAIHTVIPMDATVRKVLDVVVVVVLVLWLLQFLVGALGGVGLRLRGP